MRADHAIHRGWILMTGAALAALSGGAAAAAEIKPFVAQIGEMTLVVRERSTVLRSGGGREPATPGTLLYTGDVVEVAPCQPELEIIFVDADGSGIRTARLPDHGCSRRIEALAPMALPERLLRDLQGWLTGIQERPLPQRLYPTFSQSKSLAAPAAPPIARSAEKLLGARQSVTADLRDVVALWDPVAPGPYEVVVRQDGKTLGGPRMESGLDVVLRLDGPVRAGAPAELVVTSPGGGVQAVRLDIVPAAREPLAPDLPKGLSPGDPRTLTVHGTWLLLHGGPEWRLQALGRLAQSARVNKDFFAARLLHGVLTGEWKPQQP